MTTEGWVPTKISYKNSEGFGGVREVYINGVRVQAVKQLVVDHAEGEYSQVFLILGGCDVEAVVEPRERCACRHPKSDHYPNGCGWCNCKVAGPAQEPKN